MNEIEKLYENAGIYPDCRARECGLDYCPNSSGCGYAVYPGFTSEKQLELIKWLTKNDKFHCLEIEYFIKEKDYKISTYQKASNFNEDFTETLASLINNLWQDLTKQEKEQIRNILKG